MNLENHDKSVLNSIASFRDAGFALHWLHPRQKRPIGDEWSDAPVASLQQLRATHKPGNNLGVRLGEWSQVAGGYLHTFDLDIRIPDLAEEAWERFNELFPDVDPADLPCVTSGSGGESRHLHFISDKAFRSKKLATSQGKHRGKDGKWHYDWEIELFGTGKQVAMPPSIHPDTGKPYTWIQPFDFDGMLLGDIPFIPAADIERLAVAEHETFEFENRPPLDFVAGQLDRVLRDIPDARIDDYDDWVMLGHALHHQFGGSEQGYNIWLQVSARSPKFEATKKRELLQKWRGFGRSRRKPVTMATIIEWAKDARIAELRDAFDEEDDEPATPEAPKSAEPATPDHDVDPFDLLGTDDAPPVSTDDLLGGDSMFGDDEESDSVDDIDAIGTAAAAPVIGSALGTGDWLSLLDIDPDKGAIRGTLHNVELIVRNDPRLVGLPQLNEFMLEPVQRAEPGVKAARRRAAKATRQLSGPTWSVKDPLNGDLWSDDRDFAVRSILEAPKTQGGYGIKLTDRDLKAAIVLAANDNRFHPVREYLEKTVWDGVPRVSSLFHDYVGAPDDAYSREVSRLMMTAAVTRIYEPGHKFDFAVILEGLQGKRKSTFIAALGNSWFGELNGDFHDQKQMIELMQGKWIMEIPELSGFNRGDVRSIKAFISTQKDRARLAYARRAGEFPRQCIFIGSTNDREYLKDDTGGRRFWPMMCALIGEIDIDRLNGNVDQLWAEALHLYRTLRESQPHGILPLYLADPEAKATAARLQESRRVESADDALAGRIEAWLSAPINSGSYDDDHDDRGEPVYRTETCLAEIWSDCLGNDQRSYNQAGAQSLGRAMGLVSDWHLCTVGSGKRRFPKYGQQRFYSLDGDEGYLRRGGLGD